MTKRIKSKTPKVRYSLFGYTAGWLIEYEDGSFEWQPVLSKTA